MSTGQLKEVEVSWLHPNPDQPRKHFDPAALDELADSILANGLQQPITATDEGMIIAGERRYRACVRAKIKTVACLIHTGLSATEVFNLSMIENVLRKDMTPGEEARGFQVMLDHHMGQGLKEAEAIGAISKSTGLTKVYVRDRIKLLKLPDEAMEALESGELSKHQAWWAVSMPSEGKMRLFLKLCEQGRCNTQEQITAVAQQIKAGAFSSNTAQDLLFKVEDDPKVREWNNKFRYTCEQLTYLYGELADGIVDRMAEQSLGLNHQRIVNAKDVCKKLEAEVQRCKASLAIRDAANEQALMEGLPSMPVDGTP